MEEKYKVAFDLKRAASAEKSNMKHKMQLLTECWSAIPEPKEEWGLARAVCAGMGYLEKDLGNYQKAITHFEHAIEVDKKNVMHSNHFELGVIYLDYLNQPEKAQKHFQKALDISERAFQDKNPRYFLFLKGKL